MRPLKEYCSSRQESNRGPQAWKLAYVPGNVAAVDTVFHFMRRSDQAVVEALVADGRGMWSRAEIADVLAKSAKISAISRRTPWNIWVYAKSRLIREGFVIEYSQNGLPMKLRRLRGRRKKVNATDTVPVSV